jgi:2-octaprenyl-6-methoxyphenol hydroxylase
MPVNDEAREVDTRARGKEAPLYDVVVVGGGLIGKTLALALSHTSLRLAIIESTPEEVLLKADFDARSIALSLATQRIIQGLGLWSALKPFCSPIRHIHVSEEKRFAATRLDATEHDFDDFGYVCEIQHLNRVFHDALKDKVTMYSSAKLIALKTEDDSHQLTFEKEGKKQNIISKLIVAADGANSTVRKLQGMSVIKQDYHQKAIVANIGLHRSHHNRAYERFCGDSLMALLPMVGDRAALVWALPTEKVAPLLSLSSSDFLTALQKRFGYRLGRFTKVGGRQSFPLSFSYMPKTINRNVVYCGNAAHGLHPIAGQGFNLGLRDAATLADCLSEPNALNKIQVCLDSYQLKRERDQKRVTQLTHGLIQLFTTKFSGLSFLRDMGLFTMDSFSPLKNTFVYYAAGFSEENSRLASGVMLPESPQKKVEN